MPTHDIFLCMLVVVFYLQKVTIFNQRVCSQDMISYQIHKKMIVDDFGLGKY